MYRFKIPKIGYSHSSPDEKMILHSGFPLLKLKTVGEGTLSKPIDESTITDEVAHNLGYKPIVYVFGNYLDETEYPDAITINRYKFFNFKDTPGLQLWDYYRFYADTSKLYITFTTNSYIGSAVGLDYFYYIFYDEDTD